MKMNYQKPTQEQMDSLGPGVAVVRSVEGDISVTLSLRCEVNIPATLASPLNADDITRMVIDRCTQDLAFDWGPVIKAKIVDEA
jgi:hypothetical protein